MQNSKTIEKLSYFFFFFFDFGLFVAIISIEVFNSQKKKKKSSSNPKKITPKLRSKSFLSNANDLPLLPSNAHNDDDNNTL